ncbi:hypothetical protein BKA65DRAFT_513589 [Rhexocercosporidium sp. MPI-PUGE-AT-0058]|nr:hypothetical protein BKA65DRAFT_513589 [Rhexocercosporidium sp. MPI-PUGE-AT-0058]
MPVRIDPTTSKFQDQSEYLYFVHFRDEITLGLSGMIPQKMWNCVILRACNNSLPLRHLSSSVAALSKARNSSQTSVANEHRVFAARYYGTALRGIQNMINTTNESDAARLTLLASLLIFCFECLQGEHEKAVEHIKVAMGMMRNRFSTSRRHYSLIRRIETIPGLEDELVDIFVRIDNTLMARVNCPGDRGILNMRYESDAGFMLDTFRDLREAKQYLDHHMFCAIPYLARLPHIFMYGTQIPSVDEEETGAQLLEQFRQWNVAFAPLFASARKKPMSQHFIAAASLRCFELGAEMSVRKISAPATMVENFVKEATEIVVLSRRIVTDSSFRKTFVFECGILPVLFMTFLLCTERSVRVEIVKVLKLAEGRVEVTWDAVEIARMVETFLHAEGDVPGSVLNPNTSIGAI